MYMQHLAYEYGSQGACLALAARREDRLQQVAQVARELGSPDVIVIAADVSRTDDCKRLLDQTVDHFGRCKSSSSCPMNNYKCTTYIVIS